ncbi:MAG: DUF2063 domain-containing protein [Gammaproteobacteria bacterium]
MPSLAETQADFVKALRDGTAPPPSTLMGSAGESPVLRFNVYRNNVHVSLVDALAAIYPTVQRLVGEAFFRAMARVFVGAVLPATPVLIDYGEGFPSFIEDFEPAAGLPYLGDVARIDRAWHRAYHAAEALPLAPRLLQRVPPQHLGELILALHPSAQALSSHWPALSIWLTNRHDEKVRPVDLASGDESALVCRPGIDVGVWRLPPGAARFVAALAAGVTLAEATAAASLSAPDFDLSETLQILLGSGALTGYRF